MKKFNFVLIVILVASLGVNVYYFASNTSFEKKVECSKFVNQATDRIRSYYAERDTTNISPSEIFFSKKRNSCVATWVNTEVNPALNGTHRQLAVFDAVTNESLYSETLFFFTDKSIQNSQTVESNATAQAEFEEIIKELKN